MITRYDTNEGMMMLERTTVCTQNTAMRRKRGGGDVEVISLFNKELSLFLSLSLTVTSELVVPGNSHGRDFLCSLQSPIGSLGRLPVGLGSWLGLMFLQ